MVRLGAVRGTVASRTKATEATVSLPSVDPFARSVVCASHGGQWRQDQSHGGDPVAAWSAQDRTTAASHQWELPLKHSLLLLLLLLVVVVLVVAVAVAVVLRLAAAAVAWEGAGSRHPFRRLLEARQAMASAARQVGPDPMMATLGGGFRALWTTSGEAAVWW